MTRSLTLAALALGAFGGVPSCAIITPRQDPRGVNVNAFNRHCTRSRRSPTTYDGVVRHGMAEAKRNRKNLARLRNRLGCEHLAERLAALRSVCARGAVEGARRFLISHGADCEGVAVMARGRGVRIEFDREHYDPSVVGIVDIGVDGLVVGGAR